jgi:hypothetical protein
MIQRFTSRSGHLRTIEHLRAHFLARSIGQSGNLEAHWSEPDVANVTRNIADATQSSQPNQKQVVNYLRSLDFDRLRVRQTLACFDAIRAVDITV